MWNEKRIEDAANEIAARTPCACGDCHAPYEAAWEGYREGWQDANRETTSQTPPIEDWSWEIKTKRRCPACDNGKREWWDAEYENCRLIDCPICDGTAFIQTKVDTLTAVSESPEVAKTLQHWVQKNLDQENRIAELERAREKHQEDMAKLYREVDGERNNLRSELRQANDRIAELERENEQLKDPGYCPVCQSCGVPDCCSVHRCRFPGIGKQDYDEMKVLLEEVCKENEDLESKLHVAREALEKMVREDNGGDLSWQEIARETREKLNGKNS